MRPRLELRVSAATVQAVEKGRGDRGWQAEMPWANAEELRQAVASLSEEARARRLGPGATVWLEPGVLQVRALHDLPPVSARALQQLVAAGSSRFFRQNGHSLVTATRWTTSGTPPVRVARAIALDRTIADALVAGTGEAGLELEELRPAIQEDARLSLLPREERDRRAQLERRRLAWTVLVIAGLWLAALLVATARLDARAAKAAGELEQLAPAREALLAARQSLDSAAEMIAAIEGAAAERDAATRALIAVTRRLPDSTVLLSVEAWSDGRLQLQGRAAHALTVARVLGRNSLLGRPRLTPETSTDSALGAEWERFTLGFGGEAP